MKSDDDSFSGDFGLIRTQQGLLPRLIDRYPRRLPTALDHLFDFRMAAVGLPLRLVRVAKLLPRRSVLVLGIEVPERSQFMRDVKLNLVRSRHDVRFSTIDVGARGKFENLNVLLARNEVAEFDWIIITDDDIAIPSNFLDCFIFVLEHFKIHIGQPAHTWLSYATWELTRRRWGTIARRTNFVEIGPLVALHRDTFGGLLPFPDLRMGWGLDFHWALVAQKNGWSMGIVDALPVRHLRPIGRGYDTGAAIAEGRKFISVHGGMSRRDALRTVTSFNSL